MISLVIVWVPAYMVFIYECISFGTGTDYLLYFLALHSWNYLVEHTEQASFAVFEINRQDICIV